MKKSGKIYYYNGKFGNIINNKKEIFDFEKEDISFNEILKEGEYVEFREEKKENNLKLARNIKKIKY